LRDLILCAKSDVTTCLWKSQAVAEAAAIAACSILQKPKAAGDWIVDIAGAHRRYTPCGLDAADVRTVRVLNPVMVDECYGDCSPVETIA